MSRITAVPRNLNVSSARPSTKLFTTTIPSRHPIKSRTAHPCRLSCFQHFDSSLQFPSRNPVLSPNKRRRLSPNASSSSELPLLPFPIDQVLIPFESKKLHLYEARYLALLEESLFRKKKLFVHFVLDPIVISDSSAEESFAAKYGCVVIVEKVERLDVGALVSIRGIGRAKIVEFLQADPYLKGLVIPLQDKVPDCGSEIISKVVQLKESLYSLNGLEIKLKAPKEVMLQTQIANSLMWAEKEHPIDSDEALVPSFAERVSFAALQPVSGSSQSELLALREEKLRAMDVKDTMERLNKSIKYVKDNISMVAAKLAIQSLGTQ